MPSTIKIIWKGKQVEQIVNRAVERAMNETMEAAVSEAKLNAPVDTGALQADIRVIEPARLGNRWQGKWGNTIYYAIYQEAGTIYIRAKYYLRNAMDKEYPHYKERLRKWMTR